MEERESHSVVSNSLQLHGVCSPWYSLGQNAGVGILSFLQGIFPTQGSNPGLPRCGGIIYQLSHREAREYWSRWVAYLFSSRSSQPRIKPEYPALQVDSLPTELIQNGVQQNHTSNVFSCLLEKKRVYIQRQLLKTSVDFETKRYGQQKSRFKHQGTLFLASQDESGYKVVVVFVALSSQILNLEIILNDHGTLSSHLLKHKQEM